MKELVSNVLEESLSKELLLVEFMKNLAKVVFLKLLLQWIGIFYFFRKFIFRPKYTKIRIARAPPPNLVIPRPKKEKDPKLLGIRVGHPLPENGTCMKFLKIFLIFRSTLQEKQAMVSVSL